MKSNSGLSRRTFLSGVTAAGVGSAMGAVRLPSITNLDDASDEIGVTAISEDEPNNILLKRLIPKPESVHLNDGKEVILHENLTVNIELGVSDTKAKMKISDVFKEYFRVTPIVNVTQKNGMPTGDAYKINALGTTLTISAANLTGVRYALSTLHQLADANNGTEKLVYYSIPETVIEDSPAMSFRGLHLCWFPETEVIQIEQYLRWAAYYKFNYVVIEFWGTFPFISHPVLSWEEHQASLKDIRRLVKISKELNVTLIPQYNIFGHASGSRYGSGKHATLDLHPEYQPLFEPDGWVWCLSNPVTRKVLSDAVLETLDAFENPPYYHIGGDESWGAAECRVCRHSDYKALMVDHLNFFHQLLAKRNSRMMMWHDMLISKEDPRWKGYVANGTSRMEGVIGMLPKDILICDWQYWGPKKDDKSKQEPNWPSMPYFKEQGFEVLACPWNTVENIKSLGRKVNDSQLDGLLCTTWHSPARNEMLDIMMYGAQAAWSKPPYADCKKIMGMRHLRQVGWSIPNKTYRDTGINELQVRKETYIL